MKPMASLGAATALGLSLLVLVACGDSSEGGGGTGSAGGPPDDEARLEFAECMREHGIDIPDPQPGGGPIQLGGPNAEQGGDLLNDPEARDALEACQEKLGDAGPQSISPQQRQEFEDAALRFAQCMRDHGVDVPDPQFEEGPGGGFGVFQAGGDADSPAFREASQACQDELPQPPGGGPGGPG
jgi:hypothetical protein